MVEGNDKAKPNVKSPKVIGNLTKLKVIVRKCVADYNLGSNQIPEYSWLGSVMSKFGKDHETRSTRLSALGIVGARLRSHRISFVLYFDFNYVDFNYVTYLQFIWNLAIKRSNSIEIYNKLA